MSKLATFLFFLLILIGAAVFVVGPILAKTNFLAFESFLKNTASVFFTESSKPEVLKQIAAEANKTGKRLRILIVPGHDNDYWGTEFRGIKEADMNSELGQKLAKLLATESKFEVILTRGSADYNPIFSSYFSSEEKNIVQFANEKKQIMANLISEGKVSRSVGVIHNDAPNLAVLRLYGINKWANENNIGLVVHLHFNDYPRRNRASAGDYSGFSIYVPERQYSNARASNDIALSVSKQLKKYYPESNMPKEETGVVEDQDLIALGAFNTLDPAALLIEYGYIYEPQFENAAIRGKIIEDLAVQTYIGINNFFGNATPMLAGKFESSILPYKWQNTVSAGTKHNESILSLQAALTLEGVYPPEDSDKHDCPISGTFGRCTKNSLALFQKKHGLTAEQNQLGEKTRGKLNELYGE
jgi:N-acetylmuramoyl-L-alanine amidase